MGIKLWHVLVAENETNTSHFHSLHLLQEFTSIKRDSSESIDSYWNRYWKLIHKMRSVPGTLVDDEDILRKQFLLTLGEGFGYIVKQAHQENWDPFLMSCKDEDLKHHLRNVYRNVNGTNQETATISSFRYANAMKQSTPPVQIDTSITTVLHSQGERLDALTTCVMACAESLTKIAAAKTKKRKKYCWSCGEQYDYSSRNCTAKKTGHQDAAHWKNRMEGSKDTIPDDE